MEALTRCQNSPLNANQDIMSFAGFCESRDELAGYLCKQEISLQNREQDLKYGFKS
jgi:hypothetical protein